MPDIDGILCDVHGVLYIHPHAIEGSPGALKRLRDGGMPFRCLTNSTQFPKSHILASLKELGIDLQPHELMTSPQAAGMLMEEQGFNRVGWLCNPALAEDLPQVSPVIPGSGDTQPVDAVLVGDMGEGFNYEVLNQAFRWLDGGARLVGLARNRFYQSHDDGLLLDCGPFLSLLEDASGQEAIVSGKPSPAFFEAGLTALGTPPETTAMIGDDLEFDVLAGMQLGLVGILVRTGKFRQEGLDRSPQKPNQVVRDLAQAVEVIFKS